jgi:hypothetical protein
MDCDQCKVLRFQLSLVAASLHKSAVESHQPCVHEDKHERRLQIYQDKAIRDKAKIYRLIEHSRSQAKRMSQKIEFLLAEIHGKDELIAELMADEDDEGSISTAGTEGGACALIELHCSK